MRLYRYNDLPVILRIIKGYTQRNAEEMADDLHTSPTTFSSIARGSRLDIKEETFKPMFYNATAEFKIYMEELNKINIEISSNHKDYLIYKKR